MLEFDGWVDEFVECCQCGVVSCCEKAFRRHFKSINFALVITDVRVVKCAYLMLFSVCLCLMLFSEGHVSSKRLIVFAKND